MRCITPKRVTSLPTHLRVIAFAGNTARLDQMSQRWQAFGNTVSDLTGLRFEPRAFHSRNERVTARATGQSNLIIRIADCRGCLLVSHSPYVFMILLFSLHFCSDSCFAQVQSVMKNKSLNINMSPVEIYKSWISQRETETGEAS